MGIVEELVPVRVKLPIEEEGGDVTVPVTFAAGMRTDRASIVPVPVRVPVTTTSSPTRTLLTVGELTSGSV
jgi:hypothetical protein